MNDTIKYALVDSISTVLYVILVAVVMFSLGNSHSDIKTVLIPISMLLLFVFSAGLTAMLVFGRPIMWYLDGKKKEAIRLLILTLGIILAIAIIFFISMVAITF